MENDVMHINQDKLIILLREISAEYQRLAERYHHQSPRYINTILGEIDEITAAYHLRMVRKTGATTQKGNYQ